MALPGNGLSTTARTPPTESYATRRSPAPSTNPLIRALFDFRAPEGWHCIDHTVNPPKLMYADGTIEFGKPMRTPEAAAAARPRSTNRYWFLIGNALIVLALWLRYLLPWFRRKKPVR